MEHLTQTVTLPFADHSDGELIDALSSREPNPALGELIRRHQIAVYRHLTARLADIDRSEQMTGLVFVLALQRIDECELDRGSARRWLLSTADDVLAKAGDEQPDRSERRFVDPAVYFRQSVHRAVVALPQQQRDLLLRVDLDEESIDDVAKELGLTVEQANEQLDAARAEFEQKLAESQAMAPKAHESETDAGPPTLGPGSIVDRRYLVKELVGAGGMGAVYRATHVTIKRDFALKTLHAEDRTRAMVRERFEREAEVLGKLHHENFVDVSDFGEAGGGLPYLVMELVDGHSLADEVAQGPLAPPRALELVSQVLNGLSFAHERGIVHRDIKPDNVLVVANEDNTVTAKILDLGIATDKGPTDEDGIYGTPAYMAPEQIMGQPIDGRTDLYAVGAMLFELLTGDIPFNAPTAEYILALHISEPPPSITQVMPTLENGRALQKLLEKFLAKEPNDRFASADDARAAVVDAIALFGGTTVAKAVRVKKQLPAQRTTEAEYGPSRDAKIAAVLFTITGIIIGLIGWFLIADK